MLLLLLLLLLARAFSICSGERYVACGYCSMRLSPAVCALSGPMPWSAGAPLRPAWKASAGGSAQCCTSY
jgi:hypothetical protein